MTALWLLLPFLVVPVTPVEAPALQPQAQASSPASEEPIDFARARELLGKQRRGESLTPDEQAYLRRAMEERRRTQAVQQPEGVPAPAAPLRDTSAFKPLTEMSAEDRYQGEDGGLYGQGRNSPPDDHRRAAEKELARIRTLDAEGKPAPDGKIVFVSISMSNATQEFSAFKRLADADPGKSARLTIVDCAQGGQAMAEWVDPKARPWEVALQRIAAAGVTPEQVQVAWVKLANKGPRGNLQEHGRKLKSDTLAVLQNAKAQFPNLRIAYLSSRIYAGYATGALNPEPYAYESAFVARWLIQGQAKGDAALAFDAARGQVKAPLLLWGPYMWANGSTPRKADSLTYLREDLAGDGVHPSESGRMKVARLMLDFFKADPLAAPWFVQSSGKG